MLKTDLKNNQAEVLMAEISWLQSIIAKRISSDHRNNKSNFSILALLLCISFTAFPQKEAVRCMLASSVVSAHIKIVEIGNPMINKSGVEVRQITAELIDIYKGNSKSKEKIYFN